MRAVRAAVTDRGVSGGTSTGERATPRLAVSGVTSSYGGTVALRDVSLAVQAGEIVGVAGPNGAGKSTLVQAILGLQPLDAGSVALDGRPVGAARARLAYLPQRASIDWDFPALVHEVVRMGRYPHRGALRRHRSEDRRAVAHALERVGLDGLAGRRIGELSGGQQQRVFLARALAQEADVILLDEPFAGVDALTEQLLVARLRELAAGGVAVLLVHHDLATVAGLVDRLLLLSRRPVAWGTPSEVLTPDLVAAAYGGLPTGLPRLTPPPADRPGGDPR